MRQLPADKYNIAWFKLADFVIRGERERALGVYRLLKHSMQDDAFVLQLEGDILLSFNDTLASEKYRLAAQLYKQSNRLVQALSTYEQLLAIKAAQWPDISEMIALCCTAHLSYKIVAIFKELSEQLSEKKSFDEQIYTIFEQCHHELSSDQCIDIACTLLLCAQKGTAEAQAKNSFFAKVLSWIKERGDDAHKLFLHRVKKDCPELYAQL
jgi:hypothetical protein